MQEPTTGSLTDRQVDEAAQLQELIDEYGKEWRIARNRRRWMAFERFGIGQLPNRVEASTPDGLRAELDRVHLEECQRVPFRACDLR